MAKQVTRTETHYRFSELGDKAKDRAKQDYECSIGYSWSGEAMDSIKALAKHFGGRVSSWEIDWSDYNRCSMSFDMPELTHAEVAARLAALGDYDPITLRGKGDCKLTGYCADEDAIDGARKWFLSQPAPAAVDEDEDEPTIDVTEMMSEAFDTWIRAAVADYAAQFEDAEFSENCDANDYWFTEDGELA